MPELNAKLFGTPAVSVDGREITLPYKKADALLYYLILKRKTTRSELIGLLYEDTDSATALKNLRHAIYTIRKAFAFDPFVPGQRSIVEFSADVEIACDVYDFERGDMLSAYHGEFLKDFNVSHSSAFDAWLSDQRNLYQSQYLHQLLAAEKEAYYAGKLDLAEKYGTDALTVKEDGLTGYFQILERELASLRSTQFGANAKELDQLERQLLYVESRYYIHGGEYDAGLPVVGQLLKSSTTAGDWQMAANAHLQFIYYAIQTYDLPVMREHLRLGMQYKSRLENTPDWGKFLRLQGLMYLMIGEYDKCRSWLDRSISFFESLDADGEGRYVISIAGAYNYIAETYRLERNFDKALEYYDKAILFNQRRGSYPGAAIIYTDYGVAAYQSGEKEVARELLSYAEELYQSFHEYSQMPIALSYLALFDVEDGQYVSAAARLSKALDVGRKMGSPWWNGITLYITWKISLLLEKQAINVPELSVLWPQDKRKHCIECLDCLHRLEPRTETAEMEQTLEALNAEKAES